MDWKNCTFKYVEYNGENASIQVTAPKVDDVSLSLSVPLSEDNTDYVKIKKLLDDGEITIVAADQGEEWSRIRTVRDDLLVKSDWTQGADTPLASGKKTEWATYRGKLRDLPEDQKSKTKFSDITWPTKP